MESRHHGRQVIIFGLLQGSLLVQSRKRPDPLVIFMQGLLFSFLLFDLVDLSLWNYCPKFGLPQVRGRHVLNTNRSLSGATVVVKPGVAQVTRSCCQ